MNITKAFNNKKKAGNLLIADAEREGNNFYQITEHVPHLPHHGKLYVERSFRHDAINMSGLKRQDTSQIPRYPSCWLDKQRPGHFKFKHVKNRKPKIVLFVDVPNWAFDRIAKRVVEANKDVFDFQIVYWNSPPSGAWEILLASDLIVVFGYWQGSRLCTAPHWRELNMKTVIALYDHNFYFNRDPNMVWMKPEDNNVLDHIRGLMVSSGILLNITRRFYGGEVYEVPDGVDIEKFHDTYNKQNSKIFTVGWAGAPREGLKGLHLIQDAVKQIPNVKFLEANRDKKQTSFDDMIDFYKSIDCYICASACEGTPNPILEACSCGLPCISTKVGLVPEINANSNGILMVKRSAGAIAEAIVKLRDDRELARQMGENNRKEIVANWNWPTQLSKWCTALNMFTRGKQE